MESRIRLVALDIDGTLLDSQGNVPDANRDAIARAIASGVEIVLATGRRYEFARTIFERLPPPLTLILSNGAIVKTREGETLMRSAAPRDRARCFAARRLIATPPRSSRSPGQGQSYSRRSTGITRGTALFRHEPPVPERSRPASSRA